MQARQAQVDPVSTIWAGLVDGTATTPRPSRFFRPRSDFVGNIGDDRGRTAAASFEEVAVDRDSFVPVHSTQQQKTASVVLGQQEAMPLAVARPVSNEVKPWAEQGLIPTQPDAPAVGSTSAGQYATTASIGSPGMAHDPEIVQMNIKDPEIAAHQVTILPTDGVVVCNEKLHRVGSLLDSGHTLAAHLGLFEGVPDCHTPDSLAVEGMKPEEKRAWSWWSRLEASEVGSGSRQLPPLDIDRDRAPVPSTASGNKSSVAQKTPALELLYGLPPGTLSAEHVAFFLRPSNAAHIVRINQSRMRVLVTVRALTKLLALCMHIQPILTAALRVIKSRQHCLSAAGLGALYVDPRLKIEIEALQAFQQQLKLVHATLLVRDGVGISSAGPFIERLQSRIDFLQRAIQPLKQKDIIKKQASQLRKPVWQA